MHFLVDNLGRKSGFFKDSKKKKPEQPPASYTISNKIKILAKILHPLLSPSFRRRPESMSTPSIPFGTTEAQRTQRLTEKTKRRCATPSKRHCDPGLEPGEAIQSGLPRRLRLLAMTIG